MKQTETQTVPTSNTHPEVKQGTEIVVPVRKRSRRRRLSGW